MNAATYLIDIFALCYLCGVMRSSTMMKSKRIKPFTIAIALALVSTLSEIGAILASEQSDLRTLHILCNAVGFALAPMIPLALIAIFDVKLLGRHKEILLPTAINLFAVALSPVNGKIFYVNAANQYFRGEFYPIFVAVYVFNLLMLLFYTLYITRKHRYPIIGKVASLLLFTIVCTIIQIAYPTAYSTWHCVTVSLVLYYLLMSDFDSSFDALSGLFNRISFDKVGQADGEKGVLGHRRAGYQRLQGRQRYLRPLLRRQGHSGDRRHDAGYLRWLLLLLSNRRGRVCRHFRRNRPRSC